ncbi:hypothetical protein KR018_004875, partial [Drosophila ironensis]
FVQTDSRRSVATNDESVSMYLSFDADDTLSSGASAKWQSAITQITQSSQLLEIHTSKLETKGVEEKEFKRGILRDLSQLTIGEPDQNSPLRPFDKSIFNKHNALSSTPSKDVSVAAPLELTHGEDKENAHPDEFGGEHAGGDNSTLSSSVDVTANTVKAITMKAADLTLDDDPVKESPKPSASTVYPLSANVVLENITEVSNEGVSLEDSPLAETVEPQMTKVVNEVSELIAKALKISSGSVEPPAKLKVDTTAKKRLSIAAGPTGSLARPRRSYLPTSNVETRTYAFKQRMSVVVKTTLNSPARKLSSGGSVASSRRSCLPVAKPKVTAGRKSVAVTGTLTTEKTISKLTKLTKPPGKSAPPAAHNCKVCGSVFRVKSLLDTHVRTHDLVDKPPLKRINTNPWAPGSAGKNCCKYCDKSFALERALHIHLLQNCCKIPPGEKRKLQFTELNHETKAKLPKLAAVGVAAHSSTSALGAKPEPRMSIMPPAKAAPQGGDPPMAPPSTKKVPKKVAHAGVYRTPTKTVPCHICKQSFKSILEFTNHSLTVHAKATTQPPSAAAKND